MVKHPSKRYGKETITVGEINFRKQLAKQIGISIPNQLLINKSKNLLHDLSIPASTNATFEEYLLEVFFGNFHI